MDIGLFHIEFEPLLQFLGQHPVAVLTQLFAIGGWVIFAYMLLYVGIDYYQGYRQDMHTAHWKWVVLAIDIPIMNAQTPKAVEQMFTQLAGALEHGDIADHYRGGHKQRWFSFEIISIEGYIQFLIRTEEGYRDLVEASIYAQYPEAEITEVEDYVESVPGTFPNPEYEMWASDFTLAENDAYPIRTYREFEHTISKDMVLKDPMSAFLEAFSRIGPGEQLWFQILIEPTGNSWKEKAISKIKEVIGDTSGHGGKNWVDKMSDLPIKALVTVGDQIFGREASPPGEDSHEGPSNNLSSLTPGQTKLVEAMENKISYIGFKTKIRAVYVARKEVFRKDRAVAGLVGAINQFNVPSANSIVPSFGVGASYFFKASRSAHKKNLLMGAYKKRKLKAGANPFILNVSELATIWHFPMSHVKTPLLQKAQGKKAEPPAGLPVERLVPGIPVEEPKATEQPTKRAYRTDSGDIAYLDDDQVRFG